MTLKAQVEHDFSTSNKKGFPKLKKKKLKLRGNMNSNKYYNSHRGGKRLIQLFNQISASVSLLMATNENIH